MTAPDPEPITPYAGTSGYSGSDTSYQRAVTRDADGRTVALQRVLLVLVDTQGPDGLTVAEARRAIPAQHHGSISGALSNLHRAGRIACLTSRRERCHPYVTPSYVNGRPTRPQGKRS
jgi:hypothetical protein